jgi:ubiquinone/menaquinone biosynthesis C-methylase UbiE/DNA-binding transcriptional ArsR family regulator
MPQAISLNFSVLLEALKAASEETRLRILALLAQGELSVSDLTDILAQSQPRISRHLKLLVESGLVQRHREGAWAFFRLADRGAEAALIQPVLQSLNREDAVLKADAVRLDNVRHQRAQAAQSFFARLASDWDRLQALQAPEEQVEAAILTLLKDKPIRSLLDLGTGTGKMLRLLGKNASRAVGLDASHAMLSVARAQLEEASLTRIELRQGDIHAPPVERNAFDVVVMHQVLHYLDDPARALREAAALLAPQGRLLIVDFAPHALEFLREKQAHRRLGFAREQVAGWLQDAGLDVRAMQDIAPTQSKGDALTVSLWLAQDRRVMSDLVDISGIA